jgi:hypothetical protein
MKTQDNDMELRKLLKEIQLDTPSKDFTIKVMDRVWEDKSVQSRVEEIKNERILGKGFWIILVLFIGLFAAVAFTSGNGGQETGQLSKLMQGLQNDGISEGYKSFFSNLGSLPLSIGGILLASTLLVFIDRIFASMGHGFIAHKS